MYKSFHMIRKLTRAAVRTLNTRGGVTTLAVNVIGVKGDERSYEHAISLRAVISEDAMTADWVELPHALLRETSNAILNQVPGVNRVFYDISTKPPASIELE